MSTRRVLAVLGLTMIAPRALATDAGAARATAPSGRTAAAILADVVKAIGAPAAWKAHKNVRMKLEMTFQGMGISGAGERFATKDDKSLVVTDLPGMGTIRQGANGKIFWAQDAINGQRELSGSEADWAYIESAWNPELRTAELYKSVEAKPDPGQPGLECLLFTPRVAPPFTNCYDAKTHLQVSQKGVQPTPQGDTPFTSVLKDWREVGGLKMPFAVETQAGPITFLARMSDVKFDQALDDKMFEPPAAVGAAAGAPKAKAKTKAKPAVRK